MAATLPVQESCGECLFSRPGDFELECRIHPITFHSGVSGWPQVPASGWCASFLPAAQPAQLPELEPEPEHQAEEHFETYD